MNDRETDEFAGRAQKVLDASVAHLDARTQSRLTQARHAALEAATMRRRSWLPAPWLPIGAAAAAGVVGVALWLGQPSVRPGAAPLTPAVAPAVLAATAVEDVEIYATNDSMELFAEDPEFYEWAGGGLGTDDIG